MAYTNRKVNIYSRTMNWKGEDTTNLVGEFDVYLEQHSSKVYVKVSGDGVSSPLDESQRRDGFFIIFQDVDLKNTLVEFDEKTFEIMEIDRYHDMDGNFHHTEATFR